MHIDNGCDEMEEKGWGLMLPLALVLSLLVSPPSLPLDEDLDEKEENDDDDDDWRAPSPPKLSTSYSEKSIFPSRKSLFGLWEILYQIGTQGGRCGGKTSFRRLHLRQRRFDG